MKPESTEQAWGGNVIDATEEPSVSTEAESRFNDLAKRFPNRLAESWDAMAAQLRDRKMLFGGTPLPTSLKPHFIPADVHQDWVERTETFSALLEKVAKNLSKNPHLLKRLGFGPRALELFSIDSGLSRATFNGRPDGLWDGSVLKFVEYNSDSPAMMTYTDRVQELQSSLFPLCEMSDEFKLEYPNRTLNLLECTVDAYRERGGQKEDPTIAIVDWAGQKTCDELIHTSQVFTQAGYPTIICDPGELSYRDGRLVGKGQEIDIVQRRVLFPEFVGRYDELTALLSAYREGTVTLVNPLSSYLVGSKGILALLRDSSGGLDAKEMELASMLLPRSLAVNESVRTELETSDWRKWVLKPVFGHGGHAVVLGCEVERDEWLHAVSATKQGHWIAQESIKIPQYQLPDPTNSNVMTPYYINWTPWIFGGRFAGGTSRCSSNAKVSITQQGALLPALAAR